MRRLTYWVTPFFNADTPSNGATANVLGRAFDTWLERKLHDMFDSVTLEPLPAELLSLVNQLNKKDGLPDNDK